jgi:KDO2-lipid IV(A) lauroyltransferase
MAFKYRIEYFLLRTAYFFINILPLPLINLLTHFIGWLAWIFVPFRITVAYDNLTKIFPLATHSRKLKILRQAYSQFVQAAGLIFVIHRKNVRALIDHAEIKGLDLLEDALAQGKGVILTTYHGCWFEAYFAWFSRGDHPTSLIYQQQSNPLCDAFFVRLRRRYGPNLAHIHSLEKLSTYLRALEENRILIISLDQNYTDNGTPVMFFNHQFTCARGTGLLHLMTKAPVLTSVYYVREGTLHIDFETVKLPDYKEISDTAIQQISNLSIQPYEKTIRLYPHQWFSLFHRLWKKDGYPSEIKRNIRQLIR